MTEDPDLTKAEAFLSALDYEAERFTFQCFSDMTERPKPDPLARIITARQPVDGVCALYRQGAGVYITVNELDDSGKRRREHVRRIRAVWAELDNGLPSVWPLTPTLVVTTSVEHYHCYWMVADDWPADQAGRADFAAVMAIMIADYKSDPAAKDITRVLRLPGFANRKYDMPFQVEAIGGSGHKYSREKILAAFKPKAKTKAKQESTKQRTSDRPTAISSADEARIRAALALIPSDEATLAAEFLDLGPHLVFIEIGQALHQADSGGDTGFALWRDWCAASPKFDEAGLRSQWASFKADREITIATLFHFAMRFGWRGDPGFKAPWSSEIALAEELADTHQGELRYIAETRVWMHWTGKKWQRDKLQWVKEAAMRVCKRAAEGNPKLRIIASDKTVNAIVSLAGALPLIASPLNLWDADPMLLGTPDGVVDLRTGELRAARPEDYITKSTAVAPDPPGTRAPMWQTFLDEILPNRDIQKFLRCFFGYALTAVVRDHTLAFGHGSGGNGKGTLLGVMTAIWNDYATKLPTDMLLASRYEKHPTEIAKLWGARLAVADETEEGRHWNEAKVKTLTGGDKLTARFMRQDFFDFAPSHKLFITGNDEPQLKHVDEAMRRRFVKVPFNVTIPSGQQDTSLPDKLVAEYPAILRWAIAGCLEWQCGGLQMPEEISEASEKYLKGQDSLGHWIEEVGLVADLDESIEAQILFGWWRHWCRGGGLAAGTIKTFSPALSKFSSQPETVTLGDQCSR